MKGDVMTEPRLLQVFLSRRMHGVYEVSVIAGSGALICTCPGFTNRKTCKHVTYVRNRLTPDGGYVVDIGEHSTAACHAASAGDATAWRRFVLHHCPTVVI